MVSEVPVSLRAHRLHGRWSVAPQSGARSWLRPQRHASQKNVLRWEAGFDGEFLCKKDTGTRLSRSKLAARQNLLLGRAEFFIR
jgi:hypothetical protein